MLTPKQLIKKGAVVQNNKVIFKQGLIFKKTYLMFLRCPFCGRRLDKLWDCPNHGRQQLNECLLSLPIRIK